jgi:hypothetical protein
LDGQAFSIAEAVFSAFHVLLAVRGASLGHFELQVVLTHLLQEAADADTSCDVLVSLLESLGSFLKRVKIQSNLPCTPAIRKTVAKIMAELLAILALVIVQIRQGTFSEPFPIVFVVPFMAEIMAGTYTKNVLGGFDVDVMLRRIDRLTKNEARVAVAQTLEIVYCLINGLRITMDGG